MSIWFKGRLQPQSKSGQFHLCSSHNVFVHPLSILPETFKYHYVAMGLSGGKGRWAKLESGEVITA